jgi:class 3 adenylate cyclase
LEAVVEHLKLRKFALYGLSEGGSVAIAYAARHPRRVSRLVLYGTYARGLAEGREDTAKALVDLVRAEWGLGSRTLSNLFMPEAAPEDVRWFVKLQQLGATQEDAAAMLQANMDVDVSHLLSQVKCPTLVVHVTGDLVVPFELGREIAGGIPNARLVPTESDHHILDPEAMAQGQKAILDFLLEEGRARGEERAAARPEEAGPVTVLFTDVEGSTALTQRLGDARARQVMRTHERMVREALAAHGGAEVKTMGDGFMASFSSASRALECAIAMQRAFADYNAQVGAQGLAPLRIRIGLNAGEPIAEDADLFGTAVIVAARIAAKAEGGEILASDVVRQLVAGKEFLFADLGDTALRGFEDPVRVYEVRWRQD